MLFNHYISNMAGCGVMLTALAALSLGGCYGSGSPSVAANPQSISFAASPVPNIDEHTVTVSATASSGLAVSYSSTTPNVCIVDSSRGVVTGKASGTCTIAANQPGNTLYAPAPQIIRNVIFRFSQTITFADAPFLRVYDLATVSAVDSSGLPISYSSITPNVCSVKSGTGLVTALSTGVCSIAAGAGALEATQTISVSAPPSPTTVPGTPTGVTATAGDTPNTVVVSIGASTSGGSLITGYTVLSDPAGITTPGSASPITVTCPSSCAGYAFSVFATNAVGSGAPSARADVITAYNVVETFKEPATRPNDSIFVGSFTYNSTTATVTNLSGKLSESMTGGVVGYPNDTMTWLPLNNQLSAVYDPALGGLLVTTFMLPNKNTLSTVDGWAPGTWLHYEEQDTAANPGNAYAMIFVNTANPTATLTQAQIDKLAYADCAPGGMMGGACMTGTTKAGYGIIGSMHGYPVSQVITKILER